MQSFTSHFTLPFDRQNNGLTVHSQKFNSLLVLRPHLQVCLTSMGIQVVFKWLQLPGQADSQQGIFTRLVVKVRNQCSCIL